MGYSARQQCYKLRRISDNKEVFAAHCTFNEDKFPFAEKKFFVRTGDDGVLQRTDGLLAPTRMRKLATKKVVVTNGRPENLLTVLKAQSTFEELEEEHHIALAVMVDAREIANALTLISTIDGAPRSVKTALKGAEADEWLASLEDELRSHRKFDTLGPALQENEMPEGTRPVPLDAVLKTKRDGRKKARLIVKVFTLSTV